MMNQDGFLGEVGLLVVWAVVFLFFGAYNKNVQETTLNLGKAIATDSPENPTGLQDAITPRWQTRNNIIFFVIMAVFAIQCFVALAWYYAIAVFLVCMFVGVPLVSRFLMLQPMSKRIVAKIQADLRERRITYEKHNDSARLQAINFVIERVDQWAQENN